MKTAIIPVDSLEMLVDVVSHLRFYGFPESDLDAEQIGVEFENDREKDFVKVLEDFGYDEADYTVSELVLE